MNQPHKLPEFKGYTVDFRLREFRKVLPCQCIQFVPFNTTKGRRLLNQYEDRQCLKRA